MIRKLSIIIIALIIGVQLGYASIRTIIILQNASSGVTSNTTHLNEEYDDFDCTNNSPACSSGWVDEDFGAGVSSTTTFDGESVAYMDSVTGTYDYARRYADTGSFGGRTTATWRHYIDEVNSRAAAKFIYLIDNGTYLVDLSFTNEGVHIRQQDGSYDEIGTNINLVCSGSIATGCWQVWTIDINWTAQTFDLYRNVAGVDSDFVLLGNDISFDKLSAYGDGVVYHNCYGFTTNCSAYVDYLKVGDGLE